MSQHHVVVDGSNLATEGRTLPSLQQLDEAVRSFIEQYAPEAVTVVVDATFPNRVEAHEKEAFEEALRNGELITPPAGVIGRGDAFLLEIADRAGAVVLSNDSFQEFHGQYSWLFEQGRLIGGKPVPHVGWVFMDRAPVRGPLSRRSISEARKAVRAKAAADAAVATPTVVTPAKDAAGASTRATGGRRSGRRASSRGQEAAAVPATAVPAEPATASTTGATPSGRRRRDRGPGPAPESGIEPYNDPLPFIEFVAAHPVGSLVEGEVERFASHGAYIAAGGARCYLPLKNMADPPPRRARELLKPGETYSFVIQAIDTPRRGVDLAIPGVVPPPTEGTTGDTPDQPTEEERVALAKKATTKRAAVKKAAVKKAAVRKAPAKKAAVKKAAVKKAPVKKAAVKKAAVKKAAVKRAPVKKAAVKKAAVKKAAVKRAPVKKAAVKKAAVKKAVARKAPAKRTTAR
ncbi:MAG: S1 RNA-binding domain-containing protein [Acidimicrobiia bacterium]